MEYYVLVSISLLLVLLRVAYSYFKRTFNYWKDRGVPEVPSIPMIGFLWEVINSKNMHLYEIESYKKCGRVYGYYENTTPNLTVGEPALLRDILVKDFQIFPGGRDFAAGDPYVSNMVFCLHGEDWKRVRTIITPAFSTGKMKKMFDIIVASASTLSRNFAVSAERGQSVDTKRVFGAFTMDVIASCAFGTKIDSHNDPENPFVCAGKTAFSPETSWKVLVAFMFPRLGKLLGYSLFEASAMKFFKEVTLQIMQERKKSPSKRQNDFLQLMMDAAEAAKKGTLVHDHEDLEDDEKMLNGVSGETEENVSKIVSKGLSIDELISNCIVFFFAGYETTASTLSFAGYLLALNPSCQEKAIEEIDECIRRNENKLNYEAVQEMKYLDMVISETLRVYPPAIRTERLAAEDYKLGDTGITVKKGMIIGIPIYAMHHDPEFYPDPEKFEPLRFTPEEKGNRGSYTFLPFGDGPRNCLGMRFALFEIKICLAYVLSKFRFKKCPETQIPLNFDTGRGLLQPKAVTLKVEERKDIAGTFFL